MSNDKKVTLSSGNVFADLGFANPEEELLKAKLIREIRSIIKRRRLTQAKAAVLLGLNRTEAEDASQETLVVALRRITELDDDAPLEPWLYQISRRIVSNMRNLGAPVGDAARYSRLFSSRPPTASSTLSSSTRCSDSGGTVTAPAASNVKPPAKTASCRNNRCASPSSSA